MFARVQGMNGRIVDVPFSEDPNTNYEENVYNQVLRYHGVVLSISDELMEAQQFDELGQVTSQWRLKNEILREFPEVVTDSQYLSGHEVKIQGEKVLAQGVKNRIIKDQPEYDALVKRGLIIETGVGSDTIEQPEKPQEATVVSVPSEPLTEQVPNTSVAIPEEPMNEPQSVTPLSDINIDMTKNEILAISDKLGVELTNAERELPKVKLIDVINGKASQKK